MSAQESRLVTFLKELMERKRRLQTQMAKELGVNHATFGRWLAGKNTPGLKSCFKLARYSGEPLEMILYVAGYVDEWRTSDYCGCVEFREFARRCLPDELDEDLITMLEVLIDRRRKKLHGHGGNG